MPVVCFFPVGEGVRGKLVGQVRRGSWATVRGRDWCGYKSVFTLNVEVASIQSSFSYSQLSIVVAWGKD